MQSMSSLTIVDSTESTASPSHHLIPVERGVDRLGVPGGNVHHGDNFYGTVSANNVGGTTTIINPPSKVTVFDLLRPYIACDALYNSGKRAEEHASICHPGTRSRILEEIRLWLNGAGHPVCWLHGPAGTGKSTIAHTIAEECEGTKRLAGTFFFARKKGDREDVNKLIPTLAYKIGESTPTLEEPMQEAMRKNSTLLSQTIHEQFLKLIVEPLKNVQKLDRYLIIIDGLDECAAKKGIQEVIELIGGTVNSRESPLRFLLTSRPERHIEAAFRSHLNNSVALWLALEDSRDDVRVYLKAELQKVRDDFSSILQNEPTLWPPPLDLDRLVNLSDGLFIYASTAVQYIGDGNGSPQTKLQKLLKIHKGLDPLYAQVVTDAQEPDDFHTVMGIVMYLRTPITIRQLSWLLQLDIGDIRMALDRCRSILIVPLSHDEAIRPYHASLRDFLTNQERSQDLFFDPSRYHLVIFIQCIKNITSALLSDVWPLVYASKEWRYHGSLFLSAEPPSQQFDDNIETEVKRIDSTWIEFWMRKVLDVVNSDYLNVNLPKAKPKMHPHRGVYDKLKYSERILHSAHGYGHTRELNIIDTDIVILVLRPSYETQIFIDVVAGQDIAMACVSDPSGSIVEEFPIRYPKDPDRRVVLIDAPYFAEEAKGKGWSRQMDLWLEKFSGKRVSGVIVLLLTRHNIPGRVAVPEDFRHWETRITKNIIYASTDRDHIAAMSSKSRPVVTYFNYTYHSVWQIVDSVIDNSFVNGIPTSNMQEGGSRRRSRLGQLFKIPHLLGRSSGAE